MIYEASLLHRMVSALPASMPQVQPEAGYGLPQNISAKGWVIDWLIGITGIFVILLFVIMVLWMVGACVLYGRKHKAQYDHGSAKGQIITAITISLVIFAVVDGNLFYNSMVDVAGTFWNFEYAEAQPNVVRIEINAHQWAWDVRYPGPDNIFNTADDIVGLNTVHVPVDAPVILQMASVDVIHSLYLPNLRAKMDVVPGAINRMWFQATKPGAYDMACAQHCGTNHYKMKGKLIVMPQKDYESWQKEAAATAAVAFDPNDATAHWGWPWKKEG